MKWFDKWFYNQAKKAWDNKDEYENSRWLTEKTKMAIGSNMGIGASMAIERNRPEGEDRISFELSTAVGGRILNVRRYDDRKDRHDSQTYVIPNGEDVGERVAKIINIELFK
jgi:hypothetical protein